MESKKDSQLKKHESSTAQQLNHLDKLARSILLSARDIPPEAVLPQKIKTKIQKIISIDAPVKLRSILEREVVGLDSEIGTTFSGWRMLHICARENAQHCLRYLAKAKYQENKGEFMKFINAKTVEGYSPAIVAIINRSHEALEVLLKCGGIKTHTNDQKLSPYEIALNYRNDRAIRLLMTYESNLKNTSFLNEQFLKEPQSYSNITFTKKLISCLLTCVSFGFYSPYSDETLQQEDDTCSDDAPLAAPEENSSIDYVAIGSRQNLPGYDIQWISASQIIGGTPSLFESYNPFDTQEKNFTIKNNLIIFQCLASQPWLLRKLIAADQNRRNYFSIMLHPNRSAMRVSVDNFIPYIKDRNQPMFLSNSRELWPMILQKGLAKFHNGYFSLADFPPEALIEEITGFPTFTKDLSLMSSLDAFFFLEKISHQDYMFCLKGKKGSKLSEDESSVDCFNILNFYNKNDERLILVGCSFVSEWWTEKEKNEPLALKLIKGHYNTHNQMCVWVGAEEITQHFSEVIISSTFHNYERSEMKIVAKKLVFFRFHVTREAHYPQNSLYFQLADNQTYELCSLKELAFIKNEGTEIAQLQPDIILPDQVAKLPVCCGEYMACFQLPPSTLPIKHLLLLYWAPFCLKIECIEEELGILEWLGNLKNQFKYSGKKELIKSIGGFSIILVKKQQPRVSIKLQIEEEKIIEGQAGEGKVEMIQEDSLQYCVLKIDLIASGIQYEVYEEQ